MRSPGRVLSVSAWVLATVSALCVLAPSLSWVSGPRGSATMYTAFAGSSGVATFAPRLVGAMVAVPAAVLVALAGRSWRRGSWTVAAFAVLGQMTMSLEWISTGHRLASAGSLGSLQIGWYVDLCVVIVGSVAIAVGASVLIRQTRNAQPPMAPARTGAAVAAVVLGAVVIWLLSSDLLFMARWPWEAFVPPLSALVLLASWTVVVIGVIGPVLAVAAARDRVVAVGVVCGWWAFLAVPCTEAVATWAARSPLDTTPSAFWIGTALAGVGGAALIAWLRPPRSRVNPGPPLAS